MKGHDSGCLIVICLVSMTFNVLKVKVQIIAFCFTCAELLYLVRNSSFKLDIYVASNHSYILQSTVDLCNPFVD